ncbi:MAG: acyl-CoA dehydrogenase family protein [Alphaproteobacteria bacterium]|nr:acyl-CoA dehydrogenase family protein [Alphaproteobacteria bacterium]
MLEGPTLEAEYERFREEAIDFYRSEFRPEWLQTEPDSDAYRALGKDLDNKLIARGWYTLHWPTKYGGKGGDLIQYSILREVAAYFRAPTYGGHGRYIVGPALFEIGTEEQKARHLPRISRGELIICLGFTEPDAGSDLAAMKTRAVDEGGHFRITGTKLYITFGHFANVMLLAARTDPAAPKHKGVSLFLVDLSLPGVNMKPLDCFTGHRIAEMHFDNVRVPKDALVGELNRGFYHMTVALNFERSGMERPAAYLAHLEDMAEYCRASGLWQRARVRQLIGSLAAQVQAWRMISWRVVMLQHRGLVPSWEGSLAQLYRKDINPQFGKAHLEIFGNAGLIERFDPDAILDGRSEWFLREGFNNHGQGGRFVTRNVIARRGMGLPAIRLRDHG